MSDLPQYVEMREEGSCEALQMETVLHPLGRHCALIDAVREQEPTQRIGMHIHDTRGLRLANFHAALEMGIDLFDAPVGGLGGCPFAGNRSAHTAGNICTEDAVFMCQELGIETGIDPEGLIDAARMAESIPGFALPGRIMHSGSLARFRGEHSGRPPERRRQA